MAFVPSYRHDVFVSYAQVDDQSASENGRGWITTLRGNLVKVLARKLGRDVAQVWQDRSELAGNVPLTPEICRALAESATLLVVLSPGYLASDWCRREREAFLEHHGGVASRVFLVELDRVERAERPTAFSDLRGYRFWVQEAGQRTPRTLGMPTLLPGERGFTEYHDQLNDLGQDMAKELKRLAAGAAAPPAPPAGPAVFLAEATDDLSLRRDEVRRYLEQAGLTVFPQSLYLLDPEAFEAALRQDLARCEVFVQLLSAAPGRKGPDLPAGYVGLQYAAARAANKRVLQWRDADLDPAQVSDWDHRALLEGETVRAEGIEKFKQAVVTAALPPPPATDKDIALPPGRFVFLSADARDRAYAEMVARDHLIARGYGYAMPLTEGDPASVRQYMEVSLQNCDAVVVIYGAADQASVLAQVLQCRKVIAQREAPVPALAVYDAPPPPSAKGPLSFRFPNLGILDCRTSEAALQKFLEAL